MYLTAGGTDRQTDRQTDEQGQTDRQAGKDRNALYEDGRITTYTMR